MYSNIKISLIDACLVRLIIIHYPLAGYVGSVPWAAMDMVNRIRQLDLVWHRKWTISSQVSSLLFSSGMLSQNGYETIHSHNLQSASHAHW